MIPEVFSYEVIEAKIPGSVWNPGEYLSFMQDYESWYGRKDYAEEVAGGYYAVRLPVAEFLIKEVKTSCTTSSAALISTKSRVANLSKSILYFS